MDNKGKVIPVNIEDEVKESYLNYAMSVIVSRALPDVRDGLKPVHRRILYAMYDMGLHSDRPFKKCGLIVGDVLGKYHPHGDMSIYDALVRLAQEFSMRYPVVRGQGNFGSIDGDPPAAYRYTESKMQKIAEEMLRDIKKETVDFGPNYDESRLEPLVLPSAFPCLLVNGGSGIAVGMATNLAPHNLVEVVNAIVATIDNPDIGTKELMQYVKGPDFATSGIIYGRRGIKQAYKTGKGRVMVRARVKIDVDKKGKEKIIVTEIPYMVNKANLIIKIANLVREKKIDGISDLRDESDRNGIRIVIELKRGAVPKIVLNNLFSQSQLQVNFSINNLALVNGKPELLTLKDMISHYIAHRKEIVERRTRYDLRKAEERAHILEGLKIALQNIDEVVEIIKTSNNVDTARTRLMDRFSLSEIQAQAILDMRLQKLTSLETQKIVDELKEINKMIAWYKDLLSSEFKILNVVKEEILEISEKYGDERRTEIIADEVEELNIEDLITEEDMVVMISNRGYIKRVPVSSYKNQGRGGKGSSTAKLSEDDFIEQLFIASTHEFVLFVTTEGKAYWLKVHQIPEGSRASKGSHIKGLFAISANEEITAIVSLREFSKDRHIFMATMRGTVKKVTLDNFSNAKTRGIIAIRLDDGDKLVQALLTSGEDEIILVSKHGMALKCKENQIRAMGRSSRGVRGLRMSTEDELAGVVRVRNDLNMFLLSEYGYGKRVNYDSLTVHNRGTGGQICYKTNERTGELVGVISVHEEDDVVCITSQGKMIRVGAGQIPAMGRAAMGVRVVDIKQPDFVVAAARAENEE